MTIAETIATSGNEEDFAAGEVVVLAGCPLRHLVDSGAGPRLWTACSRLILSSGARAEGPPTCLWCAAWASR